MADDQLFPHLDDEQILSVRSGHCSKEFRAKPPEIQQLINEALEVLVALGIPLDETVRRLERLALAFLAVADVRRSEDWPTAKSFSSGWALTTRQVIVYWNEHF